MKEPIPGRISIGRTSGSDPDRPPIYVTFYDATGRRIAEARMQLAEFAAALTGVSEVECSIRHFTSNSASLRAKLEEEVKYLRELDDSIQKHGGGWMLARIRADDIEGFLSASDSDNQ